MDRSDLANRMKNYEKVSKTVLMNRIPVAIRLWRESLSYFYEGFSKTIWQCIDKNYARNN